MLGCSWNKCTNDHRQSNPSVTATATAYRSLQLYAVCARQPYRAREGVGRARLAATSRRASRSQCSGRASASATEPASRTGSGGHCCGSPRHGPLGLIRQAPDEGQVDRAPGAHGGRPDTECAFGQSGARRGGVGDTAYRSLKMYAVKSRFRYSLRSWTRFATPMPLGPASARPSWPAVTSS